MTQLINSNANALLHILHISNTQIHSYEVKHHKDVKLQKMIILL
jgi:hypothetical protein